MSGTQVSSFPTMNDLLAPQQLGMRQQQNALMMAGERQKQAAGGQEQIGRAAAWVAGLPADQQPAAYDAAVRQLSGAGLLPNGAPAYPGAEALRGLAQRALPVEAQYQLGLITSPTLDAALKSIYGPGGAPGGAAPAASGSGAAPPAASAPGASVQVPAEYMPYFQEASQRTGIPVDQLIAQARQESGFNPGATGAAGEVGIMQIKPSTAANPGYGMSGVANPAVLRDPRANINFGADYLKARAGGGDMADPAVWQRGLAGYNGGGDPNYVANVTRYLPPAGGGVAARTGGVDVAGPGAGQGAGQTPAPGGQPTPSPAAPAAAQTGLNSPQVQQAQKLLQQATQIEMMPGAGFDPRAKAAVADLRQRAQLLMQADSVSYDPTTGIGTKAITGERLNAAQPLAHYVWDEKQGAFVDTSGTHAPVTPPSPRGTFVEGVGYVQSKPGGGANVPFPLDPAGIAQQKAAEAAGTAAGGAAGKSVKEMADLTRTSAQAVGNIDYGVSQLDKAREGGINTGYFSGALTTVQSALKSLGLPTDKIPFINVSPDAIGNIQTARKTLAVVSGAILQQIIGKDSPITDSKIEAFIHAQPDITSDPQAVRRVLNWARSQFVYENELSKAGMQAASQTGMVPLNFLPKYISEHGGGPIYDPASGEMQQPDGRSPSREPPAAAAATFQDGQTATGPKGEKIIFRQGKWGPV
jgi:soluble lytic murein transglycosylase-like protein